METSLLARYLSEKFQFSPNGLMHLANRAYPVHFLKGEQVVKPGQLCKYLYFIEQGCFRYYQLLDGEDHTRGFAVENQFATVLQSFLYQQKSSVGMVAEAETTAYCLGYYDWMALEDFSSEFLHLSKCLLCEQLLLADEERHLFRTGNTAQKYEYFCLRYRTASQLAKRKDIASFLGMTSTSLSRFMALYLSHVKF